MGSTLEAFSYIGTIYKSNYWWLKVKWDMKILYSPTTKWNPPSTNKWKSTIEGPTWVQHLKASHLMEQYIASCWQLKVKWHKKNQFTKMAVESFIH
jgi:hypothetical protein